MSGAWFFNEQEWTAQDLRRVFDPWLEGILDPDMDGLAVTAGATGLSVDVAAGAGIVVGDSDDDQGNYLIELDDDTNSDAFPNGGIEPADATNPRIDQIVARVFDEDYGDTLSDFQLEVEIGTPTAGANLTNHNGAAALPDTAMRLAYVLVPAGATSIITADIEDTRTSAR